MPDALNYRFAKHDEVADVAGVVAHSFPGSGRTLASWQEQLSDPVYGGGPDVIVVGEDRGRIVAALQIHRMDQWVAGAPVPMCGVGTVTVSPTYRKRRVAGGLMSAALRLAAERGDIVSTLYPFRISFYHALGYGLAGEAHQYQVAPTAFPDSDERFRVELVETDAVRAEVLAFYNTWIQGQTGQLTRSERTFAKILSTPDRGLFAYRNEAGGVAAYALAVYRTDLPRRDRFLEVEELVWSSIEARRGLYGWLSTLGDQWEQIMVRSLPSHRTGDWISEPRLPHGQWPLWVLWSPQATLMMGPMSRLLNVESAWSGRRVNPTEPVSISLQVRDGCLAGNDGTWRLELADGRSEIRRTGASADMKMSLDIATLSRIYMGALTPGAAYAAGLVECDRPDRLPGLDTALSLPEPWTFDRF